MGSTQLSEQLEAEAYRTIVARALAIDQGFALAELRIATDLAQADGDLEPLRAAMARITTDVDYPILQQARALLA